MDDRKRSFPLGGPCGRIGSDVAPILADVRLAADLNGKLVVPNPGQVERLAAEAPCAAQIVYCGTEQQVREGFAIALRAMGIDTGFLSGILCLPIISPNTEDN